MGTITVSSKSDLVKNIKEKYDKDNGSNIPEAVIASYIGVAYLNNDELYQQSLEDTLSDTFYNTLYDDVSKSLKENSTIQTLYSTEKIDKFNKFREAFSENDIINRMDNFKFFISAITEHYKKARPDLTSSDVLKNLGIDKLKNHIKNMLVAAVDDATEEEIKVKFSKLLDPELFDVFWSRYVTPFLKNSYNLIYKEGSKKLEESKNESDEDFEDAEANEVETWQSQGMLKENPFTNIGKTTREILNNIRLVDQITKEYVLDETGLPIYINSAVAHNILINIISKTSSPEEMLPALLEASKKIAWIEEVYNELSEDKDLAEIQYEELQKDKELKEDKDYFSAGKKIATFYQDMKKDFINIMLTIPHAHGGYRVIIANRINVVDSLVEEYFSNLVLNTAVRKVNFKPNGDIDLEKYNNNFEKVKELQEGWKKLIKSSPESIPSWVKEHSKLIRNLLGGIGIVENVGDVMNVLSQGNNNYYPNLITVLNILELLYNLNIKSYLDLKGWKNRYNTIAKFFEPYHQDMIQNNTIEAGKSLYSFSNSSFLPNLIKEIRGDNYENVFSREYRPYYFNYGVVIGNKPTYKSELLRNLAGVELDGSQLDEFTHKELRETLDYGLGIGFKDKGENIEFLKTSTKQKLITNLAAYFKEYYRGDVTFQPAWYPMFTLGNSPNNGFVRYIRYNDSNVKFLTGGKFTSAKEYIIYNLTHQILGDLDKIRVIELRKRSNLNKTNPIEVFDNSYRITTLPQLNEYQEIQTIISNIKENLDTGFNQEELFNTISFLVELYLYNTLADNISTYIDEKIIDIGSVNKQDIMDDLTDPDYRSTVEDIIKKYKLYNEKSVAINISWETDQKSDYSATSNVLQNIEEYTYATIFMNTQLMSLSLKDLSFFKSAETLQKIYKYQFGRTYKLYTELAGVQKTEKVLYVKDIISKSNDSVFSEIENVFTLAVQNGLLTEEIKNSFLKYYEENNVTDGFGMRSIKSIRDIFRASGNWDFQKEKIARKLEQAVKDLSEGKEVSVTLNNNELAMVYGSIKPLYYGFSDISSGVLDENGNEIILSAPVTHKNSEYLVSLLGIFGKKPSPILRNILKTMYENDLDAIMFQSVVKSGVSDLLDITELGDNLSAYVKANPNVIHELDYRNYGIISPVPQKIVDEKVLFGTQIRADIAANIPETDATEYTLGGGKFSYKDVFKMYSEVQMHNIEEDSNEVEELFTGDKEKLATVLRESAATSGKLTTEEMLALETEKVIVNGKEVQDFLIPLNDPTISKRLEAVILSIFKNRILKQKVYGASLVQASALDFADDLEIKFNKDGSIKHIEVAFPAYSQKIIDALVDKDGYIDINKKNPDGSYILNSKAREGLLYRIPTEDAQSSFKFKLKYFVPITSGPIIMMPKEVTTIAGVDFDIDKLYSILYALKTTRVESFKKEIIEEFKEDFPEYADVDIEKLFKDRKTVDAVDLSNDKLSEEEKEIRRTNASIRRAYRDWFAEQEYEYESVYISPISYKMEDLMDIKKLSREQRNNLLLDISLQFLGNIYRGYNHLTPGTFDNLKKQSRVITIMKGDAGKQIRILNKFDARRLFTYLNSKSIKELDEIIAKYTVSTDYANPLTAAKLQNQNAIAGELIGVCASYSRASKWLQQTPIVINPRYRFYFGGSNVSQEDWEAYNTFGGIYTNTGGAKQLVSRIVQEYFIASVNIVKDPVLADLGITLANINIALTLASLGYDSYRISLFLSSELINDYLAMPNKLLKKMTLKGNNQIFLTEAMLIDLALNPKDFVKNSGYEEQDLEASLALLVYKIRTVKNDYKKVVTKTRVASVSGAGKSTFFDTAKFILDVLEVKTDTLDNIDLFQLDTSTKALLDFSKLPLLNSFFTNNTCKIYQIFKDENIIFNPAVFSNLDNKKLLLSLNKSTDALTAFLTSQDVPFLSKNSVEEVAETIKEVSKRLLSRIGEIKSDLKNPINKTSFARGLKIINDEILFDAYSQRTYKDLLQEEANVILYTEYKDNPNYGLEFMNDVFLYFYYKYGLAFSPKSPINLFPLVFKKSIKNYAESLKNMSRFDADDINNFTIQELLINNPIPNISLEQSGIIGNNNIINNEILVDKLTAEQINTISGHDILIAKQTVIKNNKLVEKFFYYKKEESNNEVLIENLGTLVPAYRFKRVEKIIPEGFSFISNKYTIDDFFRESKGDGSELNVASVPAMVPEIKTSIKRNWYFKL